MSSISALGNRTLDQLKVPELKEELRKRGILPKGLKKELIERLEQALHEEGQVGDFHNLYVQEDGGGEGQDISEPQKIPEFENVAVSEIVKQNNHSNVENVETQNHTGPENDVPPQSSMVISENLEPLVYPADETPSEAQQKIGVQPKELSGEAISPTEEPKFAVEAPLPVTTGFEIESSADMETDVIVPSVPGFSHDSDLLPGTLCEAGSQSHPALPASQVSANLHRMEDSVDVQGKDLNVDQNEIDLSLMQSEDHNEVKPEQVLSVEPAVPSDQVDKDNSFHASLVHPESEIPCLIPDDVPLVVKTSSEVQLNQMEDSLSQTDIKLSAVPDFSLHEIKLSVEKFEEKFVHPPEPLRTTEALVSREISSEDKNLDMLIPDQMSIVEKSVTQVSDTNIVVSVPQIVDADIVTSDSLAASVSERPESFPSELFGEANKTLKGLTPTGRDDRRIEPRSRFEEKARAREGFDLRREERDPKRSDRDAPRDRRDYSRSRLSQEGLAKVKEEVEKATTKDKMRAESGIRRIEQKVQKDLVEERVDVGVNKNEPGLRSDPRRMDDEIKARDVKPMDIDSEMQVGSKRKEAGEDARQVEPVKRQRRWNSGKDLEAQAEIKPLPKSTTDKPKDVITQVKAEPRHSSSFGASLPSPAPSVAPTRVQLSGNSDQHFGSRQMLYVSKTDDSSNGETVKKRIVPPSTRKPTTSLRIDRFLRPFTLNAVKELLSQTGTFRDFWMDHIKSHCYVTYSTVEEAIATRDELYNLQWPPVGGKTLIAEFVDPEEVKLKCQTTSEKQTATGVTSPYTAPSLNQQVSDSFASRVSGNVPPPTLMLPPPPLQREKPIMPPKKEPEPAIPTLDDLFKKTRAKPHIYYLPLTEEQVAAKVARSKPSMNKLPARA